MKVESLSLGLKGLFVILLPAMVALGLILHFAVDVPIMDEWDTPLGMYYEIIKGDFDSFEHLFYQHNESRDAFPRLIFLAVGFTFGWHGPIFMFISWGCVLFTLFLLLNMLPRQSGQRSMVLLYIGVLISALLFSISQWENQLWGIQLIEFIPPLCLALCLWIQTTRTSFRLTVMTCALLSIISTFSYANGMVCWLLGYPFLTVWMTDWNTVSRRERSHGIVSTALYLILAITTLSFYFWDYYKPPHTPSFSYVLENPLLALQYFVAWIGAPFVPGSQILLATVVGASIVFLVTVSFVMVVVTWKRSGDSAVPRDSYAWICLVGYGLVSGLVTTAGRAGWGLESAVSPRYSTFSLWVTIGLVGLVFVLAHHQPIRHRLVTTTLFRLTLATVALLTVSSWVHGFTNMQVANSKAKQNLLTLRLLNVAPSNPLLIRLYPDPEQIREQADVLLEDGILAIDLIGSWLSERLKNPDGTHAGSFTMSRESRKITTVAGWVLPPEKDVSADFVILANRDDSGHLEVVTGFITEKKSPEVMTAQPASRLPLHAFSETFELSLSGGHQFTMFAVDLKGKQVYELHHEHARSQHVSDTFSDFS